MQQIARKLQAEQFEESFTLLEVLLYSGSFEQRLQAARWLDKLTLFRINKNTP